MSALGLCFGLLTIVPVGALPRVDRGTAGRAMLLAPLAVLPIGVAAVAAHLLARHTDLPVTLLAVLLFVVEAVLTRALHLDGLADTVDALGSGKDAPAALQIMKAPDIGPFGVVAIVLVLLLQVATVHTLLPSASGTLLLVTAWLASRQALAWGCREGVPAAGAQGLGSLVAGTVPVVAAVALTLALAATSAAAAVLLDAGWWSGPVVVLVAAVAGATVVRRCTRRLGGITGDVLGALVEVALTAALVAAVVLVSL